MRGGVGTVGGTGMCVVAMARKAMQGSAAPPVSDVYTRKRRSVRKTSRVIVAHCVRPVGSRC